ncbi:MAG: ATP-binding cassette domain-containing protein [Tissierella sp.]|uniref:ATP-binding cassette domain-containing protein n=1 Tax=Tissierella sp. TaxID=41274 RepID=UPI003F9A1598
MKYNMEHIIFNQIKKIGKFAKKIAEESPNTISAFVFYEPKKGEVLLNKKPISCYKREKLNEVIGSLPQDFKIYALSILENIIMDSEDEKKEIDIENMCILLKNLGIYNKIEKLHNKLRTKISYELDSDGTNFSGGELQKIALSRVLYLNHKFLILDEPSSALDSYSEKEFFDSILNKYSKETIVFISHKLSNITNVDKIYFIENGTIKEQGNHRELVELNGAYNKLFKLQAAKYK